MTKYFKALLLLAAGVMILSPIAMAQDAVSPVLPAPWTSRVGTQLVYVYEDGVTSAARGEYRSFLTVTNTNITTYVSIHVQVYTAACEEWIDFVDTLTPADTHVYDPRAFKRDYTDQLSGSATNGRYLVTITPINAFTEISNRMAIAYNYLSGQVWTSHFGQGATWMTNAIPRMAIFPNGAPVGTFTSSGFAFGPWIDGFVLQFQLFRPDILALNYFFPPRDLHQPVPSGNRLTFVSIRDDYTPPDWTYRIRAYSQRVDSLLFDHEENVYSIPPQTVNCYVDFVVGFDTAGNFANFIGPSASPVVFNTGGWIRIRPSFSGTEWSSSSCGSTVTPVSLPLGVGGLTYTVFVGPACHPANIWGTFAQSLGTFAGGDLLIGIGRRVARRSDGVILAMLINPDPFSSTLASVNTPQAAF